jgi:GH24 family phage-related lysozyme (muramidase)
MTTYTYDDILKRVESNGALNISNSTNASAVSVEFQIPQLQPIDFPMKDLDYESSFTTKEQDIAKVLSITQDSLGFTNTYTNSPQILINSDRVVINTKSDYLMLFGGAGVAISSKNPVNLDSDSSITMAAGDGLFLGVPNKGITPLPKVPDPKTKGDPTPNQPYEPLTLGIKLANILEDLFVILKNARIATPAGLAYFREDAQYDLANLQARLPEMLSTAVFIDGISHESTDPAPSPPTTITNPTGLISGTGMFSGGGAFPSNLGPSPVAGGPWQEVAARIISKNEGFISKAAWDVNAYRVGYGTDTIIKNGQLITVGANTTVTQAEAIQTLANYSIPNFAKQIIKDLGQSNWDKLNDNQKAALVSLGYNVGAYYISARSYGREIKKLVAAGNLQEAGKVIFTQGPKSAGGKYLEGLERRRREESALFLTPATST